jgi:hypothetical protein
MDTFVLLLLQESIAQCGACKHDQWQGYITILVVNHGIIKSISILTAVIGPMIKFDRGNRQDCFRDYVMGMPAIRFQIWTLSPFNLDHGPHLPDALLLENDTYCLPEAKQFIPNPLWRVQISGDDNALHYFSMVFEINVI